MRISIFGCTGATGLLLVNQALAEDHNLVAFARAPSKLPRHDRLTVVEGQLDDSTKVSAAVAGSDAVLSLLGPGTKVADVPPLVAGTRNIVAAMREHGVRRLVATGTPSISDPADEKDWKVGLLVKLIKTTQPTAYRAIVEIGQIVRASELDWTLVRFPFLSNGPHTGQINARNVGQGGGLRLSRHNAAAFVLQQATDTTYVHRAPFISDR
ncbi:NmrA family transcriptional regulator [Mycobacterium avium subsp. hominissuis 10-5606]|nr:NmrA family transcriptional regulator [Mycobacterium avium subsp. hominissuis 10-5606]